MSITINIEDFHSWSEIFLEIERQTNLKKFAATEPGMANDDRQERKPRSMSLSEPARKEVREVKEVNEKRSGRRKSNEPTRPFTQVESQRSCKDERKRSERETIRRKSTLTKVQLCARLKSTPCPIDTDAWLRDPRLTDAARKLNKQQMASLYEDIFKPLDVYSILCQRRVQMQEFHAKNNSSEMSAINKVKKRWNKLSYRGKLFCK